jgi:hypothetical protein
MIGRRDLSVFARATRESARTVVHPTATRAATGTHGANTAAAQLPGYVDSGTQYFVIGLSDVDDGSTWVLG